MAKERQKFIPFVPFKLDVALKFSRSFLWLGSKLSTLNPYLPQKLAEAEIPLKDREYLSISIFSSIYWFTVLFSILTFLPALVGKNFITISLPISLLVALIAFFYINFYPNLVALRKSKDIERNLLFVVRHLYVQVRSGVSLFDAMVAVSKEDYGIISREFERAVKEISTGKEQTSVLEEMALRFSHTGFKRILWQIVNSLKSGADISKVLSVIANELSQEQRVKIRKYGSQLSPYALMYLMLTVILPTLGISFLIILSSFSGIQIPEAFFFLIWGVVFLFQIMFIGMIKSSRPSVEV
jgi:archaeal flagellar protein FlaJ